ncbi:MAG TPA: ABC-2 family transporter protein [Thermomicrobiales bacterium]|nr:ABC-2 family transporter protein [Thermomicrobiales bacterium]
MAHQVRAEPRPKYVSIALTSFQQAITYRFTTLTNIALTFIWVFILYFLWQAAFNEEAIIQGFTWDDMRTYVVIAYGLNALVGWRISSNMMFTIRTGEILRDLTRPLNYCTSQLSVATGWAMIEGILSLILTLVVGLVFIGIRPPDSAAAGALFAVAVVLGFFTKALVVFCVSLLTFWTLNGVGIAWSREAVINILSGTIIPLAMMPGWLRVIAEVSPLRGVVSTPLMIYLGKAEGTNALALLALSAGWLVAMALFANWAWQAAFNRVEIQGG